MGKHLVTASCYDKRGRLLSTAVNSYRKTHPLQAYFGRLSGRSEAVYLHAELAALLKCGDKVPHSIHIERKKKDGSFGLSKPCPACQLAIAHWGVKQITYSIG